VQIVGAPDIGLLQKISNQLDDFISTFRSYRPQIQPYDERFRSADFSYPFKIFFPRKNSADNGPEPEKWHTTLTALELKTGRVLRQIYDRVAAASEFPYKEPIVVFVAQPPGRLPNLQLPSWSIKIIESRTNGEIDFRVPNLAKAYANELEKAENLRSTANTL